MEGAGGGYGSLMGSFGGDNNINNNRGMELCPTLMFPNSTTNNSNPDTLLQHFNNRHSNSTPPASNLMLLHQDHNTTNNPSKNNTIRNPSSSCYFMDINTPNNNKDGLLLGSSSSTDPSSSASVKAKIMSHPHYNRLFAAYINCQKIGAPAEVVGRLEEAYASVGAMGGGSAIGEDPALDQFMEAYCEMLSKYEQELSKPFKEAMLFLSTIESQFKALTVSSSSDHPAPASAEAMDRNGLSEEEADIHNNLVDPQAEDQELKGQLLRKYSGYLGNLKQEFMKKRKKGKLPKEARQMLLEWWSRHYKWPYPSESQKVALAETTGLDQKQINNWFINQRKRHWKPSEDMQFMVMDGAHPHYSYIDHNVVGNPFPMDISPPFL